MGSAKGQAYGNSFTIRTIWGLAKSPELSLSEEDLYAIILRETGKDSMKKLTQKQINTVCSTLFGMKDAVKGSKRTDTRGNKMTRAQRRKIYMLTGELGWNNNNARINGFVKKTFGIARLEWLDQQQCSRLIETLKSMVERETAKAAGKE